ncbi:MAG TPA: glycosyltransferase family 2 protein [Thermoanaerobaculia bacterium]
MSAPPRVTVLTTAFNSERFLAEAIESVLAQEYRDFEYVIVDDGSTDATSAILERFAKRDPRIVLVRLPENRGVGFASNRGLEIARGAYIARLDSDDVTLPGRFAAQIEALDARPELALVSTRYDLIDARGAIRGNVSPVAEPPLVSYLMNFTNPLGAHSPAMFRAAAARAIAGYDETHQPCADYDLIARIGEMAVLPFTGVRYRVHDSQITSRRRGQQRRLVLEIAQRRLSAFLEREVSFDEINAARSVFGFSEARASADLAQRVLEEAFARFRELYSPHADRVRAITARGWLSSIRREAETLRRLRYAWRWWL